MDGFIYFFMGLIVGFSLREFINTVSHYFYSNINLLLTRLDTAKNEGKHNR